LHSGFRFFKERIRNPNLKGTTVADAKKSILMPNGLMRNSFLVQSFAKFTIQTWIVASPELTKWVLVWFSRNDRSPDGQGFFIKFVHQLYVALGAVRKPWPVLRLHRGQYMSAKKQALSGPKITLFSSLARGNISTDV
jgi:hypothetical protein